MIVQPNSQKNKPSSTATKTEPVWHLTEIASDGFIRNFGSEALRGRSKIIIRPHAATVAEGLRVDELIDEILPPQYRNIYNPSWVRSSGQVTKIPPTKLKQILQRLQICQIAGGRLEHMRHNILRVLEA